MIKYTCMMKAAGEEYSNLVERELSVKTERSSVFPVSASEVALEYVVKKCSRGDGAFLAFSCLGNNR